MGPGMASAMYLGGGVIEIIPGIAPLLGYSGKLNQRMMWLVEDEIDMIQDPVGKPLGRFTKVHLLFQAEYHLTIFVLANVYISLAYVQ